jgi:hypothetical protein
VSDPEKNWSDMSPQEQLARCDEKIAEHEQAGRWKSSMGWKNTKHAILQRYTDADGNIRLPKGDGRVTMSGEEIKARNAQRRAEIEDQAAAEAAQQSAESGSGGDSTRARPKPNGATHRGAPRRRVGDLASRILAAEQAGDYATASRLKAQQVQEAVRKA